MDSDRDSSGVQPPNTNPQPQPPGRRATSFLRPSIQRAPRRRAPPHSKDRFDAETLGGRLWHSACQEAAKDDFNGEIPLEFSSIEEYIATFDPLVLEEAREGLKADWAENCAAGRTWRVEIVSVEQLANGWASLRLRVQGREQEARQACGPNTNVVLTLGRPPQRGALEWATGQMNPPQKRKQGTNGGHRKRTRVEELQGGSLGAGAGNGTGLDFPASSREGTPLESVAGGESTDGVQGVDDSATEAEKALPQPQVQQRESNEVKVVAGLAVRGYRDQNNGDIIIKVHPCCAAHAGKEDAPCCSVLDALRRFPHAWWMASGGMMVTSEREFDAVHAVRAVDPELMRHMLKPSLLREIGKHYENDDIRRRMWPEHARHPAFINYLKKAYDYKQLEAIEMAACHLGAPTPSPPSLPAAPGASLQHPSNAATPAKKALPKLSFVLIQGPPGTGKTHTVRGVLNVWHLVAFQRYYDSLVQQVLPGGLDPGAGPSSGRLDMLASGARARLGAAVVLSKPRILICTPSNAACDELMSRVMALGFCDGSGNVYRPNIIRVGADDSVLAPAVRERSLRFLLSRYRDMTQSEWQRRCADYGQRMAAAEAEVVALEASLARCASGREAAMTARRLVDRFQEAQRLRREVERLEAARDLVWGQRGGPNNANARRAETELEEQLLSEAEMVFATLSSTQRKIFKGVAARAPFHTVLIDEAGQSSEVAALQPLSFGARQVVLVGDPQQLPATILSEAAKSVAMERSLFERLQAQGCPVVLLTVQYRMHPDIRSFPSRHFYQDRLEDAAAVTALPPEPYHSLPYCGPYQVFDVARGREQRKQGGGSLSNAAEAELAACMYASLRDFLKERAKKAAATRGTPVPPTSVAVITPYREQRALLRQTFTAVCGGPEVLKDVAIETVDSYQGRQVDVVILSCVRAGASGGLGFVNDVRRMNVAITRARRSLWVLGSVSTLKANKEWTALIDDAESRGFVVHDAHAETMFPNLEYWQRKEGEPGTNGQGGKKQQQQQQQQQRQQGGQRGVSLAGYGAATGAASVGTSSKSEAAVPSSGPAAAPIVAQGTVTVNLSSDVTVAPVPRASVPIEAQPSMPSRVPDNNALPQPSTGAGGAGGSGAAAVGPNGTVVKKVEVPRRTTGMAPNADIIDLTRDSSDVDSQSDLDEVEEPIQPAQQFRGTNAAARSPGGLRKHKGGYTETKGRGSGGGNKGTRGGGAGGRGAGRRRERSESPPLESSEQGAAAVSKYPSLPTRR